MNRKHPESVWCQIGCN